MSNPTAWMDAAKCAAVRDFTEFGERTTGTCPQGHDYATEPTYSNGECRACRRERRQAKEAA